MNDWGDEILRELRRRRAAMDEPGEASGAKTPADSDESWQAPPGSDAGPTAEPESIFGRRAGGSGGAGTRNGSGGGKGSGGGRGSNGPRRPRRGGRPPIGAFIVPAIFAIILGLGFLGAIAGSWTDAIWFNSLGLSGVFWTRISSQVLLFVAAIVVAVPFLAVNARIASGISGRGGSGPSLESLFERLQQSDRGRPGPRPVGPEAEQMGGDRSWSAKMSGGPTIEGEHTPLDTGGIVRWVVPVIVGIAALILAIGLVGSWETVQLWLHRVPFSPAAGTTVPDPIFGRDISFFLFDLPFFRVIQDFASSLAIAGLVVVVARYLIGWARNGFAFTTGIRLHLALLVALFLVATAGGYQLDKLELVYASNGVATGVSYTDVHARFLALDVLTAIAALVAAFLVGGALTKLRWPLAIAIGAWIAASIVLGAIYPSFVQRFSVEPNELAQEQPYIANNIRMTRMAYGLDQWDDAHTYSASGTLTAKTIADETATFQNARLWDYRPLSQTFDQLQTLKQYYTFDDVDTDRYSVNGAIRQVMLSARELAPDKLATATGSGLSWVNQHITYTHGIGAVMAPVNEVTAEGQPQLFIRDIPPVSASGAPTISQPRIYFGETTSDYVVVGARQAEFDYPTATSGSDTQGTTTAWKGSTGIGIGSFGARLLFALRFADLNLLISDQVTDASTLLFHRTLSERLQLIAPFLRYDKDPYLVVTSDGRLQWIQDAFTVSNRFPNAEGFNGSQLGSVSGLAGEQINYIRNSVKVVMDAYDGSMSFYVADPSDPIIRAYEGVFPTLFKPLDSMSADLQSHLRYSEELFNVQSRIYAAYHVTDVPTFYSRNDTWTVPNNPLPGATSLPLEAYYVVMRMPGESNPEFLLLQPMVPSSRPNMIAWVAARNDGATRGQVRVYRFPSDSTVFGPQQIEARIDQDPTISAQFTLWGQVGSTVIRGNLIVVPVDDSLLYLEPIYLQSTTTQLPEFRKIVVASSTTVAWGDTLSQALSTLLAGGNQGGGGGTPNPSPSPGASPTPLPSGAVSTPIPGDAKALAAYLDQHFQLAQQALRAGDFTRYGQEMQIVQQTIAQLKALLGTPAP